MKKPDKEKQRRSRQAVKGGTTRLTSPLKVPPPALTSDSSAPLPPLSNGMGALRPDPNKFNVPAALIEASGTRPQGQMSLMPGRFMLTVIALAVIFIAVIAVLVSQMPEK